MSQTLKRVSGWLLGKSLANLTNEQVLNEALRRVNAALEIEAKVVRFEPGFLSDLRNAKVSLLEIENLLRRSPQFAAFLNKQTKLELEASDAIAAWKKNRLSSPSTR